MSNVDPPRPSSQLNAGQGKLAQLIATRGGQAAPEAPFVIEHREALIYMLCEAAELEHAIMCQYLFAAFSLKQRIDEDLTEAELAAVLRWRKQISHVATQEMLHLALVQNLLSAIGAMPHLWRPNMPAPANHYPGGVQLALVPFGEQALRHFMFLERPEGMDLHDAKGLAATADAVPIMAEHDIVPRLQDFATVGHLYRSIEAGFAHLAGKYGERWVFVGPPRAQATEANFKWPELIAVTDLSSAQRAIEEILEQGEGARGAWRDAHFGQFVAILDEYLEMKRDNPAFDPTRPVLTANVRPHEHASGMPLITDRVTARVTDLFNVGYEVLLQTLERYFAHTEETDAQLATLADVAFALMFQVIKPLGDLITTLPVGTDNPQMTAGPSFELFYESDYLMPHRAAAWALLAERVHDAGEFCERLRHRSNPSVAENLIPIGQALIEIAGSLEAHFKDWGATPRPRSAPTGLPATSAEETDLQALKQRAADLAKGVERASHSDTRSHAIANLFTAAHELFQTVAGASARDSDTLNGLAARLVNSVLRPLAQTLSRTPPGAKPEIAGADASPTEGPRVDVSAMSAPERIWELTKVATRLRAAVTDIPEVQEATAALQDLACRILPTGATDKTARLNELREIQAGLPIVVQVAKDGPYLVTNLKTLRNWLGEPLLTTPQLALCRCGGSHIKPLCDATCVDIGFTDAKDPKRVPDRRDSYVGQQVTILDNRGICQHSGFCTDRLSTVFRVDQDPFVAPSGGRMDEIIRAVRNCPSGALSYALDSIEAREHVDHGNQRVPEIEVTKDGPYRSRGGITLLDSEGRSVPRNRGASLEHYALCRCGHSQNKPFCSGMHWYVEFHDPVPDPNHEPTLFEWCGGLPALTRMTRLFYEKYVPQDALLAPLFANMSPDHPERVAKWLGEVFGGPPWYSQEFGGYPRMLSQHVGKGLTEEKRARWVSLICRSADDAGLPADPEFRSAFTSYVEWGSRLALENSQSSAAPPAHMPMPCWNWGTAGPPGSRISAGAAQSQDQDTPVTLPGPNEPLTFAANIKPLFRPRDRQSMKFAFDLWAYEDLRAHASGVLERLRGGTMPCDGAWPSEKIAVFARWVSSGMPR